MMRPRLDSEEVQEFCRRWKVRELAVFGSYLREDFDEGSDLDLLVTFDEEADWSLLDHVRMEQELAEILGREVDLVSRRAIERADNWVRRDAILGGAEPVFVAG